MEKDKNEAWDIWALAIVVIEMIHGTAPFAEMSELLKLFKQVNAKIPLPKKCSDTLKNLLALCLKKEEKRTEEKGKTGGEQMQMWGKIREKVTEDRAKTEEIPKMHIDHKRAI